MEVGEGKGGGFYKELTKITEAFVWRFYEMSRGIQKLYDFIRLLEWRLS
jgi:hypothetical protein